MLATPRENGASRPIEKLLRAGLLPLALILLGAWAGAEAASGAGADAIGVEADDAAVAGDSCDDQRSRRSRGNSAQYDRAIEILDLKPGDVVAEIGAGDGRFSRSFARAVAPDGRVFANELDASDVRRMRERAREDGLENFVAVEGEVDDTNLEEACCDAMMMRMVYHMLTDPEPMARSFYRALKPGGRLLILEGDPKPGQNNADGVPANRAGMGIDPIIVIEELGAVGFELGEHYESFPNVGYALLFHKPR